MKYQLLSKNKNPLCITIDETAKEDFKRLVSWDDMEFDHNTLQINSKPSDNIHKPQSAKKICSKCGKEYEFADMHYYYTVEGVKCR